MVCLKTKDEAINLFPLTTCKRQLTDLVFISSITKILCLSSGL